MPDPAQKGEIYVNLNLFDDMDGLVLHERENSLMSAEINIMSDKDGGMTRFHKDTPLGMAYVPYQQWGEVYNSGDALENGTLFPDLRFPFERGGAR